MIIIQDIDKKWENGRIKSINIFNGDAINN
jgi:hypothetical protein